MASMTVAAPEAEPLASIYGDGAHRTGGPSRNGDWALLINPAASQEALLAAAGSRIHGLYRHLEAWVSATEADVSACELANVLIAQAEEATLIMETLRQKLHATTKAEGGAA